MLTHKGQCLSRSHLPLNGSRKNHNHIIVYNFSHGGHVTRLLWYMTWETPLHRRACISGRPGYYNTLKWRTLHECWNVTNYQQLDGLFNSLVRITSKKHQSSTLVTGGLPAQKVSNTERVIMPMTSSWYRGGETPLLWHHRNVTSSHHIGASSGLHEQQKSLLTHVLVNEDFPIRLPIGWCQFVCNRMKTVFEATRKIQVSSTLYQPAQRVRNRQNLTNWNCYRLTFQAAYSY